MAMAISSVVSLILVLFPEKGNEEAGIFE